MEGHLAEFLFKYKFPDFRQRFHVLFLAISELYPPNQEESPPRAPNLLSSRKAKKQNIDLSSSTDSFLGDSPSKSNCCAAAGTSTDSTNRPKALSDICHKAGKLSWSSESNHRSSTGTDSTDTALSDQCHEDFKANKLGWSSVSNHNTGTGTDSTDTALSDQYQDDLNSPIKSNYSADTGINADRTELKDEKQEHGYSTCLFINPPPVQLDTTYAHLSVVLAKENRQINVTKGDGNCFFRSLAKCVYGSENMHEELRRNVVDVVADNANIFAHDKKTAFFLFPSLTPLASKKKSNLSIYLLKDDIVGSNSSIFPNVLAILKQTGVLPKIPSSSPKMLCP